MKEARTLSRIDISNVQFLPISPQNGLIGFAACTLNDNFVVSNIAVYASLEQPGEYRLVYSDKLLPNGKRVQCFHPVKREAAEALTKAITEVCIKT